MKFSISEKIQEQFDANQLALDNARACFKENKQLVRNRLTEPLIKNRVELKRLTYADSFKPTVAVCGEMQVGKSYMVDRLLTRETGDSYIYDGKGKAISLCNILPLEEANNIILRFSKEKVWTDPEYPIRVELLTPIDVVMVLVDTYFNDVENQEFPNKSQIEEKINQLLNKYKASENCQSVITEDEIFELKEYFDQKYLKRGETFIRDLKDTHYFEILSLVIQKLSVDQWPDVFSYLWNNEEHLTKVFGILLNCYKSLDFAKTAYIKMDAVLRERGTILDVHRIYEIINEFGNPKAIQVSAEPTMEVLTDKGKKVSGIMKSEFCVIAMEVDFTISKEGENSEEGIVVEKPFLKELDILDFPGARSRRFFNAGTLSLEESCEMLLRGKVAYLFNKYSQQFLISSLLLCHHSEQSNETILSLLLKDWISTTIGPNAEEREVFMRNTDGIPPLFLIGTKFNLDLVKQPVDVMGDDSSREEARKYRWTKRFGNLLNLLDQNDTNSWMNNWLPGHTFKNVYLLRSYEISCEVGLFQGYLERDENGYWKYVYKEDGTLQGELGISENYKDFIPILKNSFLKNEFVQRHFDNPEESWNRVIGYRDASGEWMPQNGSDLIIEKLTKMINGLEYMRFLTFERKLSGIESTIKKINMDFIEI